MITFLSHKLTIQFALEGESERLFPTLTISICDGFHGWERGENQIKRGHREEETADAFNFFM